jgi:predicted metal-dependent hydrolase
MTNLEAWALIACFAVFAINRARKRRADWVARQAARKAQQRVWVYPDGAREVNLKLLLESPEARRQIEAIRKMKESHD